MVSKCLLTSGSSTRGQRRSAGWSSGAAWRLIDQPDAVWNWKIFRAMPAGIIELQDYDAIAAGTGLTREGGEQFVDPVGKIPDRLSARGRDKAGHVEPFVAMVTEGNRPLPDRRPNRRWIGLRPSRCSSVAHTSMGLSGCLAASSVTVSASFFISCFLRGACSLRVAGTRRQDRPAALTRTRQPREPLAIRAP